MPKKKITLEEAFAIFEQHGLQVEVKAIQVDEPTAQLSDFLESNAPVVNTAEPVGKRFLKVTLYAAHTIGTGGQFVTGINGDRHVVDNGVETYGPGVVTVPLELAQHLLHQDGLARQADDRMLSPHMRSFVVIPKITAYGVVNCGIQVSDNNSFDMSSLLGKLGDDSAHRL